MTLPLLLRFKRLGVRLCRKFGLDERTIDFKSMYDSGISYHKNKYILIQRINSLARQISNTKIKAMMDRYNDFMSDTRNNPNSLYRFLRELRKVIHASITSRI